MTERRLLVLCPNGISVDQAIESHLSTWHVQTVNSIAHARMAIESMHIQVGMIYLPANLRDFEIDLWLAQLDVASGQQLHWVALLDKQLTKDATVCKLVKDHFYDFHTLPIDWERLRVTLGRAYGMGQLCETQLRAENARIATDLLGSSEAMQSVLRSITKLAKSDAPVLICGESGTGKKLAAHALHAHSPRKEGPFTTVNCTTLPANLIQAELFGHEKGAFTGADTTKIGRLETANTGTVFLNAIGDIPLDVQARLLRFLQEGTFERIGSTTTRTVDTRIIAAAHGDLEEKVAQGKFREDLYYCLNVLQLRMPPLRERREDIEQIARQAFFKKINKSTHSAKTFSKDALDVMVSYNWPGNVRELVNRVQHAIIMCEGKYIMPEHLKLEFHAETNAHPTLQQARRVAEHEVLVTALACARYNVSRAAKALDISRLTLYRLMDKHGIETNQALKQQLSMSAESNLRD